MNSSTMQRLRVCVAAGLALTGGWMAPAWASGAMATGGLTSQPIGHYDFCKQHPGECSIRPANLAPAALTDGLMRKLANVTARVNASVKPMSDMDIYGKDEVWAYPDRGVGDCEDYVLEKRRQLSRMGVSLADLLITVVRKPDGEGHAVLTVRTDGGDYVLDNLTDKVKAWDQTGYRFLKRQAIDNTGRWVSIRGGQQVLVGSVQ
ncbi:MULTISPECIES: transglutaminase-like cysteine peptidase [unclassified Mesorhizobium]|uniref:transglutaminase-like cysteine peptidase n=1 Tax=unclassified Mesorhizobium TaxID=325217 RepID=UPI00112ECD2F|nr:MULTISPECIES: transglutaminase-like cysteine peptidase [unclassified Mesorhizobium]MBZ9737963.1 transglutaminase-like cysteine peptidase [Mesorhizobium sp. CO1-1-4]MBZ9801850.1 transglutaminase-like cysteine peptidase [Mesorhizobium sp. ES1-6]MBZ9996455.1 transglutaminase-like cysteine peptidase [Mesorhizobium sp. BH1-1-4]TPL94050.1 transglutaminase [Mesorhizobium sp. B2-3-12]